MESTQAKLKVEKLREQHECLVCGRGLEARNHIAEALRDSKLALESTEEQKKAIYEIYGHGINMSYGVVQDKDLRLCVECANTFVEEAPEEMIEARSMPMWQKTLRALFIEARGLLETDSEGKKQWRFESTPVDQHVTLVLDTHGSAMLNVGLLAMHVLRQYILEPEVYNRIKDVIDDDKWRDGPERRAIAQLASRDISFKIMYDFFKAIAFEGLPYAKNTDEWYNIWGMGRVRLDLGTDRSCNFALMGENEQEKLSKALDIQNLNAYAVNALLKIRGWKQEALQELLGAEQLKTIEEWSNLPEIANYKNSGGYIGLHIAGSAHFANISQGIGFKSAVLFSKDLLKTMIKKEKKMHDDYGSTKEAMANLLGFIDGTVDSVVQRRLERRDWH